MMVRENGLKEPPPPAMVTLAAASGLQAGVRLGLGEGLALGEELALGLGEELGLGEGVCAWDIGALRAMEIAVMATTAQR